MGSSLNDLQLKDEKLPVQDLDDLPEFGGFQEPPQPGPYRFKLPDMTNVWEAFDATIGGNSVQRVRAIFDREHPLTIVQSNNGINGETFQTRISNAERPRGKDKSVVVSDMDYLLKALGEKTRPTSNKGYIEKMKTFAGKEFGADITYSWVCSPDRDIYAMDAEGKTQKVEGQKGCGKKYYMKDIPKGEDGKVPTQIQCACGAAVRCFANLDNLRA